MAGVYRMGRRDAPQDSDVFVVLRQEWHASDRGAVDVTTRCEFASFAQAWKAAQEHVRPAVGWVKSAEVWWGTRLLLWDSADRHNDGVSYRGPAALGRYQAVEVCDDLWEWRLLAP